MGWGSTLMQNETTFLILDGGMVLISVLLLTVFHPCYYFPFLSKKKNMKREIVEPQSDEMRADGF